MKRVAIQASLVDEYSFPLNQTVSLMGGLEELLVVEGDFSGLGKGNELFKDRVGDPLVSVDCGVEELKTEASIGEIWEEKTARLAEAVQKYVEENGGDGTAYMRERTEGMEKKLRLALEKANADEKLRCQRQQGVERPCGYEIPRVRMVWVMTESCAKDFDGKGERKYRDEPGKTQIGQFLNSQRLSRISTSPVLHLIEDRYKTIFNKGKITRYRDEEDQ